GRRGRAGMRQEVAPQRGLCPWRPWEILLAAVGAVAAIVFLVVALVVVWPPVASNLCSDVSDGTTAVPIGVAQASVVVPEGWVVQRSGPAVIARTPDGGLSVQLEAA